ncbi:uncharacterized protein LOC119736013 [Patiria miniata]|uniref:CCHC-type domain-containing protein n=1 Tax=Patiria miniata TaxID=46514 RepID=A0A914ARA3_PATMI|nr:uncharacterized protein LOC119736013 [Patiria miniata]
MDSRQTSGVNLSDMDHPRLERSTPTHVKSIQDEIAQLEAEISTIHCEVVQGVARGQHRSNSRDVGEKNCSTNDPPTEQTNHSRNASVVYVDKSKQRLPGNFDGTTNFKDWIVHFHLCCEVNDWKGVDKITQLAVSLRGEALRLYRNIPDVHKHEYDFVVGELRSRFSPTHSVDTYRSQLKQRERRQGEKLAALAQDIRSLISHAYPQMETTSTDHLAVSYFIDALRPSTIRAEVRRVNPHTLKDALHAAQREEDILQAEASATGMTTSALQQQRVASLQEPNSPASVSVDEKISRLEQKLEENIKIVQGLVETLKRKDRRCFNCGKPGHIRRFCKLPPQQRESESNVMPTDRNLAETTNSQALN